MVIIFDPALAFPRFYLAFFPRLSFPLFLDEIGQIFIFCEALADILAIYKKPLIF